MEYRVRRHDGAYGWFKTRGVPIRDSNGDIVKWFGTCTDITDGKRAEEALRHREQELRTENGRSDEARFPVIPRLCAARLVPSGSIKRRHHWSWV